MATNTNTFHDLPVRDFRDEITNAVDTHQVTIITAETGAGKSTQIPQYLAEHGYTRVIVTQPRILAARNLAYRVREEWAERHTEAEAEETVGYRTAHERDDSGRTKILYCTDGLQLVRELTGSGTTEKQVLVLDEVHEWNENMEVLVAWAKKRCQEDPTFRIVVMSATIEVESLAAFFDTDAVISIEGRHFPVTRRRAQDVLAELFQQLENRGRNMLVFLPGKAEIQAVTEAIEKKALAAKVPVIPLHSQLEAEDQQKAFQSYPYGKIILATNIAQTSITIDDIDMVIDSGLERQSEVRSGVEGLFIAQISQADILQRAGRAGRTKPGEYVLAQFDTMPCIDFEKRPEYAIPEIMRKHIDRLVLRLASVGIDIETLDFYHDPSKGAIKRAKKTLQALGALTLQGEVTNIGREMERFPVESNYGRMMVEALRFEEPVQVKLAAIIAIQEVGGIVKGGTHFNGWRVYTKQTKSDLLAQYEVYLALPLIPEELYEELGIIGKNVDKANEVIERLHRDLGYSDVTLTPISFAEEPELLRCITAGEIDQLWYLIDQYGTVEHILSGQQRELSSTTVVKGATLMTGTPFDLQVPQRSGGLDTLHLLTGVTVADVELLLEISPHLFSRKQDKTVYDPRAGAVVDKPQIRFGKRIIEGNGVPRLENTRENQQLFLREFTRWVHDHVDQRRQQLARFHRGVPHIQKNDIDAAVRQQVGGIVALDQLSSKDKAAAIRLINLETYLGDDFMHRLGKPRRHATNDKRQRPEKKFSKKRKFKRDKRGW